MSFSSSRVVFRWRKRPLLFYCHVKSVQLCHAGLVLNSHTEPSPNCPHTPNCHAELVSASLLLAPSNPCQIAPPHQIVMPNLFRHLVYFPPSCPTEPTQNCHAELVSASRIFHEQRQADKWNNEILKQVQDDIFFLSSFLGLPRKSGQTTIPVIASRAKQSGLSPSRVIASTAKQPDYLLPRHCERSEAIQSDNYSL